MSNSTALEEGYSSPIVKANTNAAEPVVYSTDFEPVPKKEPLNLSYDSLPELDPMVSPIPFTMPFKLRDPVVVLERCDKIWETLKVIRNVQINSPVTRSKTAASVLKEISKRPEISVDQLQFDKSYIQYRPVLGNGNDALPDFEFSVKSKQKLFQCGTCGKEYVCKRNMKSHAEKIHGTLLPVRRNGNMRHSAPAKSTGNKTTQSNNSESQQTLKSPVQQKLREILDNYVKCILCQQYVKDIRQHLINYHKIVYPDVMLKEFDVSAFGNNANKATINQKSPPSKPANEAMQTAKEKTQNSPTSDTKNEESDSRNKDSRIKRKRRLRAPYVRPSKRRRTNNKTSVQNAAPRAQMNNSNSVPSKSMIQCDICLTMHSNISSLYQHRRRHQLYGETKENFFTRSRSSSKDGTQKQNILSNGASSITSSTPIRRNGNIHNNNTVSTRHSIHSNEKKFPKVSYNNENEKAENKVKIPLKTDEIQSHVASKRRTSVKTHHTFPTFETKYFPTTEISHVTRNSSDRDSGIGISITIKKKNNSYEIVSKERSDKKSKVFCHCKKSNEPSDHSDSPSDDNIAIMTADDLKALESSKYSKDHSILKIKCMDEDVIVNIDEDSQSDHNTTRNKMVKNKSIRKRVPSLKDLCKNVMIAYQLENCKALKYRLIRRICMCGQKFKNTITYLDHGKRNHTWKFPLPCGYCKRLFENSALLSLHVCVVRYGEMYVEKELEISCPICNEKVGNCAAFDSHVNQRHFNSNRPYHCYDCFKRFVCNIERQRHYSLVHYEICRICSIKVPSFLTSKHENYHRGFGFPCHLCQRAYSTKKEYAIHKETMHLDIHSKRVKCVACTETCSLRYFRDHMHMHANNWNCKICNDMVPIKNMKSHVGKCIKSSNRRRLTLQDLEI